mgnify:CR=1 FL=1
MLNALDFDIMDWSNYLANIGEAKFRAKQVFNWLYKGECFDNMSNLPKKLQVKLKEEFVENPVKIYKKLISKKDGTRKYIFALSDGNIIEGVLMSYKYGNTICISTQVGCRMNCAFCASGIDGLVRNLTCGEMVGEVLAVNNDLGNGERQITNIVLMGSGEPFDNYDNVVKFINLISDENGINISKRNISLSTCGLCDKIYKLADEVGSVTLTISLHAPNDDIRNKIMPVNKAYKIEDIIKAVNYYFEKTGRRIIFEYSMIKGVNDSRECAKELCRLLKGMPCHVNLINLNFVKEKGLLSSEKEPVKEFLKVLENAGISATIRRTMGSDIEGACGQLRRSILQNK